MTRDTDDDELWNAIVENYGDRVDLGPDAEPAVATETQEWPAAEAPDSDLFWLSYDRAADEPEAAADPDRFVPPPPPPLPTLPSDRLAAWVGLFGSPVVLVVCLVLQISIPSWLAMLMVAGFVGGFVYLVARMPREPRDPFDDGAVL